MGVMHKPCENLFPSLGLIQECRLSGVQATQKQAAASIHGPETNKANNSLLDTNSRSHTSSLQVISKNPKSIDSESKPIDSGLKFTTQVSTPPLEKCQASAN